MRFISSFIRFFVSKLFTERMMSVQFSLQSSPSASEVAKKVKFFFFLIFWVDLRFFFQLNPTIEKTRKPFFVGNQDERGRRVIIHQDVPKVMLER